MKKPIPKTKVKAKKRPTRKPKLFTPEQIEQIHEIVNDYLTMDEFEVHIPQADVVDAVKVALCDPETARLVKR